MANAEHLKRLQQGAKAWNLWRQQHPEVKPDLAQADLQGWNLTQSDLFGAALQSANLRGAILVGANLSEAQLNDATLQKADLSQCDLFETDFSGADLSQATLVGADLFSAHFNQATLSHANLRAAELFYTNFSQANLQSATLQSANLSKANLSQANLKAADCRDANLSKANLRELQALGTNFTGAMLTGACIQDWHVNHQTVLDRVQCDYIYLVATQAVEEKGFAFRERRPLHGYFAAGEFAREFQIAVELTFPKGVDWSAFAIAFNAVNEAVQQATGAEIYLREYRADETALVLMIEVPPQADKGWIFNRLSQLDPQQSASGEAVTAQLFERMLCPPPRSIT